MEKYCILILNYNSWENTLEMVHNCHFLFGTDYQDIIVVDNESPNESHIKLIQASDEKGFVYIASGENRGYAFGNNIGLKYAYNNGYKYAWIINNDIVLKSNTLLDNLFSIFAGDSSLAAVNPEVVAGDGHIYNRDAIRPNFWDYTLGILYYRKKGRKINDLGGYSYIYRPQGCCMMLDVEKMHQVGYMDENTFLYCEEVILAERLMKKGYKCACYLKDSIIHHNSQTVKLSVSKRNFIKIYNESFCYYLKNYRNFGKLRIGICKMFNTLKLIALG